MDRISDSGSDGWGSIPHGGTNNKNAVLAQEFLRNGEHLLAYVTVQS